MQREKILEFHNACDEVIIASQKVPSLNYAFGYAAAGTTLWAPEEIKVQCLYLLENIKYWRGETAKKVRALFKELAHAA